MRVTMYVTRRTCRCIAVVLETRQFSRVLLVLGHALAEGKFKEALTGHKSDPQEGSPKGLLRI